MKVPEVIRIIFFREEIRRGYASLEYYREGGEIDSIGFAGIENPPNFTLEKIGKTYPNVVFTKYETVKLPRMWVWCLIPPLVPGLCCLLTQL